MEELAEEGDDAVKAGLEKVGDLGAEGLTFVPAKDSPNGENLLIVGNEVSGTTTVFQVDSLIEAPAEPAEPAQPGNDGAGSSLSKGGVIAIALAAVALVIGALGALGNVVASVIAK